MNIGPEDTIVAIATAPGEASVSIVRLSGSEALAIADKVFECTAPCPSERASHTVIYGHVRGELGKVDESLMIIMRAPRSYTAEDVVELHGHGGSVCGRRILRVCIEAGARLAEPGEFTKRAFLNGRIDLVQAEAVLDLIRSTSERASAAALEQLDGRLSERFEDLYERVLMETARLEATLDFPEDELPEAVLPAIRQSLSDIAADFTSLLGTWEEGHLLRDGALVVISGKPNVGKSTLLNALLGSQRAIVSDIPGTTRDSIEEQLVIGGVPLRLVDTAGLRETEDYVEQVGIERTRKLLEQSDLQLVMFDLSASVDLSELADYDPAKTIVLLNKADLSNRDRPSPSGPSPSGGSEFTFIETSLLSGHGLTLLREKLLEKLSTNADLSARPQAVISERHCGLLDQSLADLNEAMELLALNREDMIVLAASRCRDALETLGQATGKIYQEALLDRIFSSFCIGK